MAKVTGPLMSLQAKGKIYKGLLQYQQRMSVNVCRVNPKKPKSSSPAQEKCRSILIQANKDWNHLTDYYKEAWENCKYTTHPHRLNSPWKPKVYGRLLFLSRGMKYMQIGRRAQAHPYDIEDCGRRHDYGIVEYIITE